MHPFDDNYRPCWNESGHAVDEGQIYLKAFKKVLIGLSDSSVADLLRTTQSGDNKYKKDEVEAIVLEAATRLT
jgi:hypothetical protein